jgi:ABC-type sugar transport system ATPase subunit
MRVEIARLHRRLGTTMIYVTHDQIEAMTLGQRIVVFNRGEIQQIDTPMNLYTKPANLFVAGFPRQPGDEFLPRHAAAKGICTSIAARRSWRSAQTPASRPGCRIR